MQKVLFFVLCICTLLPGGVVASGNVTNDSFSRAKRLLEQQVYYDHRETIYCGASFDAQKNISLPDGFTTPAHQKRIARMEWEHAVPAENFGRSFQEWREGAPECISRRGKPFKGRRCAEKANIEYRYMQANMYNLFPAIGAVNAVRSNKRYSVLPGIPTFGTCPAKVDDTRFEPSDRAKGQVARAALYMAEAYAPRYRLSDQQRRLFEAWDKLFPVTSWECTRAKRIERLQGNENACVKKRCRAAGLW